MVVRNFVNLYRYLYDITILAHHVKFSADLAHSVFLSQKYMVIRYSLANPAL